MMNPSSRQAPDINMGGCDFEESQRTDIVPFELNSTEERAG